MEITINEKSPVPIYEQIVLQIRLGVLHGKLAHNFPMPSIRQLANDLGINHNTIAKAYHILEMENVIVSKERKGSFINGNVNKEIIGNIRTRMINQIAEIFEEYKKYGAKNRDIQSALNELKDMYKGEGK